MSTAQSGEANEAAVAVETVRRVEGKRGRWGGGGGGVTEREAELAEANLGAFALLGEPLFVTGRNSS